MSKYHLKNFQIWWIFSLFLILGGCGTSRREAPMVDSSGECGYAEGIKQGLKAKGPTEGCQGHVGKDFLRGYRSGMQRYLKSKSVEQGSCRFQSDCKIVSACIEKSCLYPLKQCRHDFECLTQGECVNQKCVYH